MSFYVISFLQGLGLLGRPGAVFLRSSRAWILTHLVAGGCTADLSRGAFSEYSVLLEWDENSPLSSRVCLMQGESAANRTCLCSSGPPSSPHGFLRCSGWPRAEQGHPSGQRAQHCLTGSPHAQPTLSHFATNTAIHVLSAWAAWSV